MTLFDIHAIDLRTPWTRARDEIGDTAIAAMSRTLTLANLRVDRRHALNPLSMGMWTTSPVPTIGTLKRGVYSTDQLRVQLSLIRINQIGGICWQISFTITSRSLLNARQLLRIQRALEVIVQEREHLSDLVITPRANNIVVTLDAQIGDLMEPM